MSEPRYEDVFSADGKTYRVTEPNAEALDFGEQIDIRKFALEQAVNSLPHLRQGVLTLDAAKEFGNYILNGRTRA